MSDLTAITVLTLILIGLCGVGLVGLVVFMFASEGLFPLRRLGKKDTSKCVVDITPISVKIVPASKHHASSEINDTTKPSSQISNIHTKSIPIQERDSDE